VANCGVGCFEGEDTVAKGLTRVERTDLARDEGSAELVESFAFAHHASHLLVACSLSHLMLKM